MPAYTLIESRDPFESQDSAQLYELALDLKRRGHEVALFLVQNGALAARPSAASDGPTELARAGIAVLADRFSLRERAIDERKLAQGVIPADLESVVDHLAQGRRVIWH
jgi:hypothetical protein